MKTRHVNAASAATVGTSRLSSPWVDPAPRRSPMPVHHHGIDIAAPIGTPIFAVRPGTVQFAGRRGAYGLLVILDHGDGLTTWYGHASRIFVAVGSAVRPGDPIAAVGTTGKVTGPNVHFEVRRNNAPLDPLKFLQPR